MSIGAPRAVTTGGNELKDMLTCKQAADYVRLAPQTLAKLRCVGGSPAFYKVGRQVLYDRADLDAWLNQRYRRSTADIGDGNPSPIGAP